MEYKKLDALKEILSTKTIDEAIILKGKYRDLMLTPDELEVVNRHLSHLQIQRCIDESKGDIPAYIQCSISHLKEKLGKD